MEQARMPLSRYLFTSLLLTTIYFISGKLGLQLAFLHASATAVWPPTGIALATMLVLGRRFWPAILLGAFLVNITTKGSVATSVGIATGNTLEALIGAYLVSRFAQGNKAFNQVRNIFKFTLLAGMLATAVSATIGVTSLALGGHAEWSFFGSIWLTWWLGDMGGALIVAPFLLLWSEKLHWHFNKGKAIEALLLLFSLLLTGWIVFGGSFVSKANLPIEFLCLPPLIWTAFRFCQRDTATAILILSIIATWGTLSGFGPFVRESQNESLLLLQAFMGIVAVTKITLAAIVAEVKASAEDLKTTNKELKRLSQIKSDFASMVSHELRTPLSSIKEGIQLVLDGIEGPVSQGQKYTLGISKENVDRLAKLINNVLDFSKLEAGKMEFVFEPTVLNKLLIETSEFMKPAAQKKEVRIDLELPERGIIVSCDKDRIKEVIINLVHNGIKFNKASGRIRIRLGIRGDNAVIDVEDTGIGIEKEDQEKLFQIFTQIPAQGVRRPGGSGLGLAICQLIAKSHKGHLNMESTPGTGSKFSLVLPFQM